LLDFNQIWDLTHFRESQIANSKKIRQWQPQRHIRTDWRGRTDGRTDKTKLISAFRHSYLKIWLSISPWLSLRLPTYSNVRTA